MTIKFRTECLYSSEHSLSITFDENGVCSRRLVHQEIDLINWDERSKEHEELANSYKRPDSRYDCIVPVSGGDSNPIIYKVRKKLIMNSL